MTQTPAEIARQHRRLAILQALADSPASEALLVGFLRNLYFHVSEDQLRADLSWLAEQGLATTEVLGGLWLAAITKRGKEVAEGHATCPGVKRPDPMA